MEMRAALSQLKKTKHLPQSFPHMYETEDGIERIERETLFSFMHIIDRRSPICR